VEGSKVRHVDVVKNEWSVGVQYPAARVLIDKGAITIDADDPERWRESLIQATSGIDPDIHPEEFLAALSEKLQGSYLFATEIHDDAECPFHGSGVLHLHTTSNGSTAHLAHGATRA
jgi:hypothetical protein